MNFTNQAKAKARGFSLLETIIAIIFMSILLLFSLNILQKLNRNTRIHAKYNSNILSLEQMIASSKLPSEMRTHSEPQDEIKLTLKTVSLPVWAEKLNIQNYSLSTKKAHSSTSYFYLQEKQ